MYDQHCSSWKRSSTSQAHVSTGSPTGFPIPRLEPRGNKNAWSYEHTAHLKTWLKDVASLLRQVYAVNVNIFLSAQISPRYPLQFPEFPTKTDGICLTNSSHFLSRESAKHLVHPPCGICHPAEAQSRGPWSPWSPWRGMLGISWNSPHGSAFFTRLRVVVPTSNRGLTV